MLLRWVNTAEAADANEIDHVYDAEMEDAIEMEDEVHHAVADTDSYGDGRRS